MNQSVQSLLGTLQKREILNHSEAVIRCKMALFV